MVGIQDMWPEELRFRNEVVGDILIQVDLSPHCSKSRVPAVYPTSAHSLFLTFFDFNEINNLRLISQAQNSEWVLATRTLSFSRRLDTACRARIPSDSSRERAPVRLVAWHYLAG